MLIDSGLTDTLANGNLFKGDSIAIMLHDDVLIDGRRCRAQHPCSLHRREVVWWPADTSDGNAVETAFRVYFDLSYTLNTHENRITKPFMQVFFSKGTRHVPQNGRGT